MTFKSAAQYTVLSLITVCAQLAWPQGNDLATTLLPDSQTFQETYQKNVEVAGQLRAGLMYESSLPRVDITQLWMDLSFQSINPGERACVRVASRNGEFSAVWRITLLANDETEQVISNFPSKYQTLLETLTPDELVAIVSVVNPGEECTLTGRRYLPTSWGKINPQVMVAYLNADSTEAVVAGRTPSGVIKENCRTLPNTEDNIAFDTVCRLELTGDPNDAESASHIPVELVVLRKNFSTVMKKLRYPLSAEGG